MSAAILDRSRKLDAPAAPYHRIARPLPEPLRSRRVSRIARLPLDRIGRLLEEWLAEVRISYTYAGD